MIDLTVCSEQERKLFNDVIAEVIGGKGIKYVSPQYVFMEEATGKKRKIDFAILTDQSKIAIELDGYTYHAEGKISQEAFSDQLQRQNGLVLAGWKILRFSWKRVLESPNSCRDALRRAIIHDQLLHPFYNPSEILPHQIQIEALQRLKESRDAGAKRGLVALATGLGKTYLSAFDAKNFKGRVLFIVHNNSILEQAKEAFNCILPKRSKGLFNSLERKPKEDIVFANISSLRSKENLSVFTPDDFEYIVVDEVHHSATAHYAKVMSYFKPHFLLGMTATPNRTDNKSILALLDNNLIYQVTQNDAIQRGYLVPFHYFALKDNVDYSNIRHNGFKYDLEDLNRTLIIKKRDDEIIEKYKKMTNGGKAIGFCVSIEHAERAADYFRSQGIPSHAIHSGISQEKRKQLIMDFRENKYKIVFVRDIFNEGVDFPDVEALLFMRPTESRIIFTQQLGRGLRLNNAKKAIIVLDFIGNYINADKITDYLSAYGTEIDLDKLRAKPLYEYDNGCKVEFQSEVLDTITVLKANVYSDQELTHHFLRLYQKLGRCPVLADIQSDTKFKLKDYLERYGTLLDFIERIERLEPDLDLRPLKGKVAHIQKDDVEALASTLERNEGQFLEQIRALSVILDKCCLQAARIANRYVGKDWDTRLYEGFIKLIEFLREAVESMDDLTLVLSFRFETPSKVFEEKTSPEENDALLEGIISNFKKLTDTREIYIFARTLTKDILLLEQLSQILKEDFTASGLGKTTQSSCTRAPLTGRLGVTDPDVSEVAQLAKIYGSLVQLNKRISGSILDAESVAEKLYDALSSV